MLEEKPNRDVRVLVVWQSILATDWSSPGNLTLRRIRDSRARQFWDGENLFPRRLGARVRNESTDPQPSCCWHDDVPWDMVALYPPGARWDNALPPAVFTDGPVWIVKSKMSGVLDDLTRDAAAK